MMMPFDSSDPPPRGELDPATTEAMRVAISRAMSSGTDERHAAAEHPADDAALRATLHRVAREARDRSIPPERLLVLLKGMWQTASAGQRDAASLPRAEQERRLRDFVTLCIAEYFRED